MSPKTGEPHSFYVIESPDWINVIPLTENDEVVCIRQYRVGIDEVTLEIPGGVVDPGERPLETAKRELMEETGYASERWTSLGSIRPNPAVQNNACHIFLAEGCRLTGATDFDPHEDIEVELIPRAQIPRYLAEEKIVHALVAVAFQRLMLHQGR